MTSLHHFHTTQPDNRWEPLIAVHLDLKGVQFRPEYLPRLLEDLAAQKVTAILVEYEDMFPFRDLDIADDPDRVWSRETLETFLLQAEELNLEVIPLQQCLGHLEYIFRWDELRHLALDYDYPSTLDLSKAEGKALIAEMLGQILEAHLGSRYVHIGLDEAWALHRTAEARGEDICKIFVEYAEELCDLCESYGKTPLIWSDMLENHLTSEAMPYLERLRERAVICTWDYTTTKRSTPIARLGGAHVNREWLERPHDERAPSLTGAARFMDEMPGELHSIVEAYGDGTHFTAIFQADMWVKAGFRTLGTTACRVSYDGPTIPFYNQREANILLWAEAAKRTRQLGIIVSCWARGTSWCPPNCPFDMVWPLIGAMSAAVGNRPEPFFAGISPQIADRIFRTLGRCREDWRRELLVAEEMEALMQQVQSHRFEWRSVILMARLLHLHRRAEFAVLEVEDFWANHRPVDTEWQRRLDDQAEILHGLASLRAEVIAHFSERYWGHAFEEWVRSVFDVYEERMQRCGVAARRKLGSAKAQYSQVGETRRALALVARNGTG